MKIGSIDTIIGKVLVKQSGEYITQICINEAIDCEEYNITNIKYKKAKDRSLMETALLQIYEYIYEARKSFTFKVSVKGSDFEEFVWNELNNIPYGETISYKELAKKIGRDKSFRAVGNANGKNPLPIVIPCHRVVKSDGSLGGYSLGLDIKQKLLEIEAKNKNL